MSDQKKVEEFYNSVIDTTITQLTPEFENAGVPLINLSRLQLLWKAYLQLSMSPAPIPVAYSNDPSYSSVHNNNPHDNQRHAQYPNTSHPTMPQDRSASDTAYPVQVKDELRYTVQESTPIQNSEILHAKLESVEGQAVPTEVSNSASSAQSAPSKDTTPVKAKKEGDDSDSESESISDIELSDGESENWTNTVVAYYSDLKRSKDKRRFTISKAVFHLDGKDYVYKGVDIEVEKDISRFCHITKPTFLVPQSPNSPVYDDKP